MKSLAATMQYSYNIQYASVPKTPHARSNLSGNKTGTTSVHA